MKHLSDFDTLVEEYARYRTSYSVELFDAIATYFGPPGDKRLLDAACGTGLATRGMLDRGYGVTGIDVAQRMLDVARAGTPADAGAAFYLGRAEALPFADGAFSGIICAQAFHWFDEAAALAEFSRVLAPGGGLAIFWKHARPDDPYARTVRSLFTQWTGRAEAPLESSFRDSLAGFWAQVARGDSPSEGAMFRNGELRMLRFRLHYDVDTYIGYHRSRENLRIALGDQRESFLHAARERVAELAPASGEFDVEQDQFLYCARKA
ncbi:MAG: class I SAM-dependent methyltransferase [Candidatus Eremiobacteraeota bacterium]|nr:class I SAM-dependent methyltransferase [Candidatus Eremiobacteraeota bacterium]